VRSAGPSRSEIFRRCADHVFENVLGLSPARRCIGSPPRENKWGRGKSTIARAAPISCVGKSSSPEETGYRDAHANPMPVVVPFQMPTTSLL